MSNVKNTFYLPGEFTVSFDEISHMHSDWLRDQYHLECDFPNTEFAVSYCKICEAKGRFDFKTGKYLKERSS